MSDKPTGSDFKPTNPKELVGIAKRPASVVSALVEMEVGLAMMEGALKYGRHNYRGSGVLASVYYDATRRHLIDWWEGQDIDPASGLSHITKAIASLYVMRDSMIYGTFTDDRPPRMANFDDFVNDLNSKAADILARYGHVCPHHFTHENTPEKK